MKNIFLSSILLFSSIHLWAQQPTDQDCLGAITVCQSIYTQVNSYSGTGNYPNEIPTSGSCPGNCLNSGEKNDVWYIFTVNTGGNLGFEIIPNNNGDDYDWAVYNLDQFDCEDIYTHISQMQVSCNYSGQTGTTGATLIGGNSCEGGGGNKYCSFIPVNAGETYVLNISNYSSTQSGYTLDFGLSTANIYDDSPPVIETIYADDIDCGKTSFEFDFNERVLCNSVQTSDFTLTGPGGPYTVTDVSGATCLQGGEAENHFTMEFDPPIYEGGVYSINIVPLSFIKDDCGNTAAVESYEFDVILDSPTVDAGEDKDIAYGGTAQLDGAVSGGSGSFVFDWQPEEKLEDNTILIPTTINLIETTSYTIMVEDESNNCRSTDEVSVNIVGGPMSVSVITNYNSVCAGDPVILEAIPSGGSGDYTYAWTSDPTGIDYTTNIIAVTPIVTTTYFVEITDGYTILEDQITINVFPAPIAGAGPDQEINMGTFTYLDGIGNEGLEPYSYNWSPPDFIDGDITVDNPKTTILDENQIYLLNIVDANGCIGESSEVTINVTGSALGAQPVSNPTQLCFGDTATLISNVSGGGGAPYIIEWRSEDGSWTEAGDYVKVNPIVDTKYFLKVNDGFTSKDSITLFLSVNPLPVIDLIPEGFPHNNNTISVCVRDTVTLDAGNVNNPPDMFYLWSNGWANRTYTASANGNWIELQEYWVSVENPITSCSSVDTISIMFDYEQCNLDVSDNSVMSKFILVVPNPAGEKTQLSIKGMEGYVNISLSDMQGKIIWQKDNLIISNKILTKDISLKQLPRGVYTITVTNNQRVYSTRIIKQ